MLSRLVLAALLMAGPLTARAQQACPPIRVAALRLPRLQEALAGKGEVTIVALGSSSTEGARASDASRTYPAVLQAELSRALPRAHIAVLNRGIGGQDAAEMLGRLQRDAIALRPAVVIWQVGANAAMKHLDPAAFGRMVLQGAQAVLAAGIDLVLMDNQRSPAVLAAPEHARFDDATAEVARRVGARLFQRGALMEAWRAAGFPYEEFLAGDGVHHNDRGYRCVAQALARAMLLGLPREGGPALSSATR